MSSNDPLEDQVADLLEEETVQTTRRDRLKLFFDEVVVTTFEIIWEDWRTRVGYAMMAFLVLLGTVGVILTEPTMWGEAPQYVVPLQNLQYPIGTNGYGEPLGRKLIHATPAMLKMMVAGGILAMMLGTLIGTAAGLLGGRWDKLLMFLTDVVLTIPGLPLILIIAAVYPPESPYMVGFLLAIDNWPGLARTLRSQVLSIRNESYVEASQALGLSSARILRKDIISQLMPYITINAAYAARGVIFESVGLYFLGILPFTSSNWGVMMNEAYKTEGVISNLDRIHWLLMPMIMITLLSMALILISQGMDRLFNPRIRARHEDTGESMAEMN